MNNMSKKQEIIGLIDADLLDNGTRHPNLVLLKLAGFFQDKSVFPAFCVSHEMQETAMRAKKM